jgi:hypothetical protein
MMHTLVFHLVLLLMILSLKLSEGATKGQIKTAFVKSLKTKKLNKKVLGEFVSLVA